MATLANAKYDALINSLADREADVEVKTLRKEKAKK